MLSRHARTSSILPRLHHRPSSFVLPFCPCSSKHDSTVQYCTVQPAVSSRASGIAGPCRRLPWNYPENLPVILLTGAAIFGKEKKKYVGKSKISMRRDYLPERKYLHCSNPCHQVHTCHANLYPYLSQLDIYPV